MIELQKLRKQIDRVDEKLLKILAGRFALTEKVGIFKKKNNLKPMDKKREREMFEQREDWAKREKLDCDFVKSLFKLITKTVRKNHKEIAGRN